jgi:hypothetical protein
VRCVPGHARPKCKVYSTAKGPHQGAVLAELARPGVDWGQRESVGEQRLTWDQRPSGGRALGAQPRVWTRRPSAIAAEHCHNTSTRLCSLSSDLGTGADPPVCAGDVPGTSRAWCVAHRLLCACIMFSTRPPRSRKPERDRDRTLLFNLRGGTNFLEKVVLIGMFVFVVALSIRVVGGAVRSKMKQQGTTIGEARGTIGTAGAPQGGPPP